MASAFSHAVAALSIGTCFYRPQIPKRVWVSGVLCSVIPDLDAIGFRFGIHYGDFWGHRGFTHSLVFAALLAGVVALAIFGRGIAGIGRCALFGYLFLATASHGVLDAMTDGGLGVVDEGEECGAVWRQSTVGGHAVDCGAHPELAHAEEDVAASGIDVEISAGLEDGTC